MFYFNCLSLFLILIGLISSIASEYIKIRNKVCEPFVQLGNGNVIQYEALRLCTEDSQCTGVFKDGSNHKYNKCTIGSTERTSYMGSILYSKERFICPDSYVDILEKSDFCFRRTNGMDTWETAKTNCKNEKGDLACLRNNQDGNKLLKFCNNCWIGYKWRDESILDTDFGAWRLDTSLVKTQCKDEFKIGVSANWFDMGQCSRLESKLLSNVISDVLDTEIDIPFTGGKCATETHPYICQKAKVDPCSQKTCRNGGASVVSEFFATCYCYCPKGYSGEDCGNTLSDRKPSTQLSTTTSVVFVQTHTQNLYTYENQTVANLIEKNSKTFSLKMTLAISCSGVGVSIGIFVLFMVYKKRKSAQQAISNDSQMEMDDSNYDMVETPHNETEQNPIENPYHGMEDNTSSNMPSSTHGSMSNTSIVKISENPYYT